MMQGTWGFVNWTDVTSDIVEGQRATFYYMPSDPARGWAGNAQRIEVKSFRAGCVSSTRDNSARVYVEFVPRGARKHRAAVQRSTPNLVILEGWQHPDPAPGWVSDGTGGNTTKWSLFAPEWRAAMDTFLSAYLCEHAAAHVLADFRFGTKSPSSPQLPPKVGQGIPFVNAGTVEKPSPVVDVGSFVSADELDFGGRLVEGTSKSVLVNAYERSAEARRRCIEHYGPVCSICDFDFGEVYGGALQGYIHVHHLKALSEIAAEYVVDPIADLRPVCPNCHAVIHLREPPYTLDEVRRLLATNGRRK